MDLNRLLAELVHPEAYPHPVEKVTVVQTHISVVFLAGEHVWKIKKPVNLGFLDFTTLERRKYDCDEEVRLNRRLAPDVYLGVEPITEEQGQLRVAGSGSVVEWAVHMRRLDGTRTLEALLGRDELTPELLAKLARTVAGFHREPAYALSAPAHGSFETIAGNARENFAQSLSQVGSLVDPTVFERLRRRTEAELQRLCPIFRKRFDEGRIRDTHGDLHLDHVYHEIGPQGERLLLIDCIEFNERFRQADPIADLAFLVMDLAYHGRGDLVPALTGEYFAQVNDGEGMELLDFYAAYRAVVRAKVAGMKAGEAEVPPREREQAQTDAAAHWLLALTLLESPAQRPCLILIGGLPGSGKSTLARGLAESSGFTVLRSDMIRKELAAQSPTPPRDSASLYSEDWTERTYATCADMARKLLLQGQRVIVDASFRSEAHRQRFLNLARELGVPARFLVAEVPGEVARLRLAQRQGDASDADWSIRQLLAATWDEPGPATARLLDRVNLDGLPQEGLTRAREILTRLQLDEVPSCPNPGTNPNEASPPNRSS